MSVVDIERTIRAIMEVQDKCAGWFGEHAVDRRYAMIDPILWALG